MLANGETAVLQLSGGKDSTALLYLARPYLDRITVLFGDTGAVYPHVKAYVDATCKALGARLQIIRPSEPVLEYTARMGLPADLVPIEAIYEMQPQLAVKAPQLLRGYMACCSAMIFEPMATAIKESGTRIVLRGSKKSDARVGVTDRHIEDGIEYRSPLWDWSDADVYAYLDREGVTLPVHYSDVPDSLDCWACTAHLAHHGAAKMRWTKEHYPELWPEVARRMSLVRNALDNERAKIASAFDVVMQ